MPRIRCPRRSQIRPCSDVPESSRSVECFLAPQVPVASSASRDGFGVPQASLSETAPARPGALGPQPQTSEESSHASQRRPQAAGPSMPRPSPGPAQRRPLDRLGVHGLAEEIHDGHEGQMRAPWDSSRRCSLVVSVTAGPPAPLRRGTDLGLRRSRGCRHRPAPSSTSRRRDGPRRHDLGQPLLMRIHQEASCHARAAPARTSGMFTAASVESSTRPASRRRGRRTAGLRQTP